MARGRGRGGNRNQRGRGGGRGRGAGGGGRGGGGGGGWQNRDYQDIQRTNALFERYYNELGIVPTEEKEEFWTTMRRELPNSFRFTGSKGHALAVQQRLIDHYIPEIVKVESNGELVDPPRPLDWFPEKLAWSMTTPKQVVRKFPPFRSFQKFLVSETSVGNISRQEVVSMIPPLVMDLQPGMTVLDLCAAPGSKSAQLIEMVHKGEEARTRQVIHQVARENGREASPDGMEVDVDKADVNLSADSSDDGRATGLLIANDINYTRAQMLVHQVKRLNSPNLIVTNHDASQFPSIRIPSDNSQAKYLKFDRILADVPCSGDGTCRKNYSVWKDWTPGNGIGLHTMQLRILVRALQMLKKGGRVVYSTCSMNPIENEAVVASAIYRVGGVGKVRLVNLDNALPGLKRVPGLKTWKVMDKRGEFWDSWEQVDKEDDQKLAESHFPPPEEDNVPLENCMRVYPHLQDTGAFFIAVLEKLTEIKELQPEGKRREPRPAISVATQGTKSSVKAESESAKRVLDEADEPSTKRLKTEGGSAEVPVIAGIELREDSTVTKEEDPDDKPIVKDEDEMDTMLDDNSLAANGVNSEAQTPFLDDQPVSRRNANTAREEPYKYLQPSHPELESIYKFYQIDPRFPRDRWMVRNAQGEPAKAIYYTSGIVRDILVENEGRGMKFVQSGIKMFMKQDAQGKDVCRWRIQSEGLPVIESWVGEDRVVRLYKRSTLHKLLKELFPKITEGKHADFDEIGDRVNEIGMGCCVLRVESSDSPDGFRERMVMPLWRSVASINIMLSKEDRRALLLRVYNDDEDLIDHSDEKKRDEAKARLASNATGDNVPATENGDDEPADPPADVPKTENGADEEASAVQLEEISAEQEADQRESALLSQYDQLVEEFKGTETAPGTKDEPTESNTTV